MRHLIGILLTSLATVSFAADVTTPVGYWKTMDELTGKPKNIIQVYRDQSQELMAKVVKVFNTGKQNSSIVGTVVMSGLKSTDGEWLRGRMLNPENGKMYNCSARLAENGKKLNIKNFFGFSMFGHSQTWERVDLMSG